MVQELTELTRKDGVLDFTLANREGILSDVVIGGTPGLSVHKVIKLKISERTKSASKTSTLDVRRVEFRLLREF